MTTRLMTQRLMVRQGDVLLIPVDRVPDEDLGEQIAGADGRVILAHGEATGHAHAIYPERDVSEQVAPARAAKPRLYALRKSKSALPAQLLRLEARALVRHEEHDPVSLPAGDWLKIIQHEGDELEGLRRVAD